MAGIAESEEILARIGVRIEAMAKMQEESRKEAERRMKNLERNLGGIGNDIGEIIEMIVIPGVKEKMNELGHDFTMISPNKRYSYANDNGLAEVDLLLENSTEVMVVEIKTDFTMKWVRRHLDRLALLRANERTTGMTGKTMYAAIAGLGFNREARELAIEKGMYVVEIDEDNERVKVVPPAEVGVW